MKIWSIAILSILAGVAVGFGGVWNEFAHNPEQFEPHNRPAHRHVTTDPATGESMAPKAVVVDSEIIEFGSGQRNSAMEHTFVFRNDGNSPLTLTAGSTSCKCTLSDLGTEKLAPGETTEVKLNWTLKSNGSKFFQTAEIMTNDPDRPLIVLRVSGDVTDLVKVEPANLVLSGVSASEGASTAFHLYGYTTQDLEIVAHTFTYQETALLFELDVQPLPSDLLKEEKAATSGLLVTVVAKPGLPLGPINQTIQLKTNVAEAPNLNVSLTGSVVSDISIVGSKNYRDAVNLLSLGVVDSSEGAKTRLRILIKGPHRHDIQPDIKSIDPSDVLAVSRGDAKQLSNGAVYMYPLDIEVMAGSQPTNRLGSDQGRLGKIVLETAHPDAKTINIYVKFAVK